MKIWRPCSNLQTEPWLSLLSSNSEASIVTNCVIVSLPGGEDINAVGWRWKEIGRDDGNGWEEGNESQIVTLEWDSSVGLF